MYENIKREDRGRVAIITIDRPKALNALNRATLNELHDCVGGIAEDSRVSVVIFTGGGEKSFIAGADIAYMQNLDPMEARDFADLGQSLMMAIENLPQIVIAAVNGFALGGGCELALACDIRYCSENAKFGQPEANLGIIPGFGGTQRMPRIVGKAMALEMIIGGDMISANEALRIGLVNKVVPREQLIDECCKLASKIEAKGPLAVKLGKEAVKHGIEMDLIRACRYEADLFSLCFSSYEQQEGMLAFLEKRKPNF